MYTDIVNKKVSLLLPTYELRVCAVNKDKQKCLSSRLEIKKKLGGSSRGHLRRGQSCSGRTICGRKVGNFFLSEGCWNR